MSDATRNQIEALRNAFAKRNGKLIRAGVPDRLFYLLFTSGEVTLTVEHGIEYVRIW